MNEGYHAEEVWEEDTTFKAVGVGSQIVIPLDCQGGVLVDASPEPGWDCLTVRGLLWWRLGGGGGKEDWA